MFKLLRLVLHWLVTALALALADLVFVGIEFRTPQAVLFGALVLAHINTRTRRWLVKLSLPVNLLTLGVFHLLGNALCFALAAALSPGFGVANLPVALGGSLIVSAFCWAFDLLLPPRTEAVVPKG